MRKAEIFAVVRPSQTIERCELAIGRCVKLDRIDVRRVERFDRVNLDFVARQNCQKVSPVERTVH